jgi:hypothetical protein
MIHFLYLLGFSIFVAIAFAVFSSGEVRERVFYGLKVFAQFLLISLALAWVLYFIPF